MIKPSMKTFLLSLMTLAFVSAFSSTAAAITDLPPEYRTRTYTAENPLVLEYRFSNRPDGLVKLKVLNYPGLKTDLFFFHMHENEITAKTTGSESVRKNGGTFMYLDHAGTGRNMKVRLDNVTYEFDPNRIFTDKGLRDRTSPTPTAAHFQKLKHFVSWVERNIQFGRQKRKFSTLVALHNNTDDDVHGELLSILTEKKLIDIDNRLVNINPQWDIDNFFIATLKSTYDRFIQAHNPNMSLILERPRDIGYLSNWAVNRNIDFITVEAQHSDNVSNRRMIEVVQNLYR